MSKICESITLLFSIIFVCLQMFISSIEMLFNIVKLNKYVLEHNAMKILKTKFLGVLTIKISVSDKHEFHISSCGYPQIIVHDFILF